jgi:hypothetical protein
MSAVVKCEKCGEYIPFKQWPHNCGVPQKVGVNFKALTHKQVLDYYCENPDEIEQGLHSIMKEVGVFRGRIDIVARDKNQKLCLIEVVHRSNCDHQFWKKKLSRYRCALRTMGTRIYRCNNLDIRLLIKRPGRETQDVTHEVCLGVRA